VVAAVFVGCWFAAWKTQISDREKQGFIIIFAVVALLFVFATLRRVHDAGYSRWWVLLFLFPVTITMDAAYFQIGGSTWQMIDFSQIIRSIHVMIGLFVSSNVPPARQSKWKKHWMLRDKAGQSST
jgi:uncharacterized membrane protein YhaH (DUF805 family)